MIIVHHLNNSRSQRILWLLEELNLEYSVKRYERDSKSMLAPKELQNIHPLGKSPVIEDGDVIVAETGAIIEYLVETYDDGALIPPMGTEARRKYKYWLHFAEGSAMPPLLMKLVFDRLETSPAPFFIKPFLKGIAKQVKTSFIEPRLRAHLDFMEAEMGDQLWFAGDDFSAADIMMSFPLQVSVGRAGLDENYPKLNAFIERVHAKETYRKALERGGQYDY